MHPELDPATYGLTIWDLDREFLTGGLAGRDPHDARRHPRTCCATPTAARIGIEYMHIQEPGREALDPGARRGRRRSSSPPTSSATSSSGSTPPRPSRSSSPRKYVGQKRFGIDGAESAIPLLDAMLEPRPPTRASTAPCMGMAHRGRLNVLANIVGKSYDQLFTEFEGNVDPESIQGSGDVKYHLGQTGKFVSRSAASSIEVELAANPSHLEAVDPVVVGMARAKQDLIEPPGQLPGAAGADARRRRLRRPGRGGRDAQPAATSRATGSAARSTSIVNNQLGLHHPARVGPLVGVLHRRRQDGPGADLPRERRRPRGLRAGRPAGLRLPPAVPQGRRDRHGLLPPPRPQRGRRPELHPAADVQAIDARRSVRKLYTEALVKRGDISARGGRAALDDFQRRLQAALDETRAHGPARAARRRARAPPPVGVLPHVDTGVRRRGPRRDLRRAVEHVPDGFTVHPKLAKQFEARDKMSPRTARSTGRSAEALAFGSLLLEGTDGPPRRPGHPARHLLATATPCSSTTRPAREYVPAGPPRPASRRKFWIYDSLLSEYAALGFEYGYSVANKDALVVLGGAVRRLRERRPDHHRPVPRRRRGQVGPDLGPRACCCPTATRARAPSTPRPASSASSRCRAEDNIQVVQRHHGGAVLPPAAPPDAPRGPQAAGRLHAEVAAAGQGVPLADRRRCVDGSFQEVLDDPGVTDPAAVRRVVLALGQGRRTTPSAERDKRRRAGGRRPRRAALPVARTSGSPTSLARYPNADEIVWLQEEPENMGAWNFVKGRLYEGYDDTHTIRRVSRSESGSPATGAPPSTSRSRTNSSTTPSPRCRPSSSGVTPPRRFPRHHPPPFWRPIPGPRGRSGASTDPRTGARFGPQCGESGARTAELGEAMDIHDLVALAERQHGLVAVQQLRAARRQLRRDRAPRRAQASGERLTPMVLRRTGSADTERAGRRSTAVLDAGRRAGLVRTTRTRRGSTSTGSSCGRST